MRAGDHIGPWIVEALLGEGGMGAVYRCRHRKNSRLVAAVKILIDDADSDIIRRFVREAGALAALDHPRIARMLGFEAYGDPGYVVMEYIEGTPMSESVEAGGLEAAKAVRLGIEVMEALQHMHAVGITHRDVKPHNVVEDIRGHACLVDFGLALMEGADRITKTGWIAGSGAYLPPEALDQRDPDFKAWDVYAAGVTLYEILTGKWAFVHRRGARRGNLEQVWRVKQITLRLDPGPGFREEVREAIKRLTESEPAKRANVTEALRLLRLAQIAVPDEHPEWQDIRPLSLDPEENSDADDENTVARVPLFSIDERAAESTDPRRGRSPKLVSVPQIEPGSRGSEEGGFDWGLAVMSTLAFCFGASGVFALVFVSLWVFWAPPL